MSHVPDTWSDTFTVVDAAAFYAAKGWPVFPVVPGGSKMPRTSRFPHGFRSATLDPDAIEAGFGGKVGAMMGVGVAIPNHLMVIDVDARHGASLAQLEHLLGGRLPRTLTTLSGSTADADPRTEGSLHLWFHRPPGVELRGAVDGHPALEVKAGGRSCVTMPPTLHPATGRPYRFLHLAPIAWPPHRLVALIKRPPPPPMPTFTGAESRARRLAALCALVASKGSGERHNGLVWAMFQLANDGQLDPDAAEALIAAAVSNGMRERDARAVTRSIPNRRTA